MNVASDRDSLERSLLVVKVIERQGSETDSETNRRIEHGQYRQRGWHSEPLESRLQVLPFQNRFSSKGRRVIVKE